MNSAPIAAPRSTARRSGVLYLRDQTAAYATANAFPVVVAPVGLKYRSFNLNQFPVGGGANRIVFIPGVFDGNGPPKARKYGTLLRESRNAASVNNPRELLSWERPITVSLWSAPEPGHAADEDSSIGRAEDLLELLAQALQEVGAATLRWGEVTINSPPQEGAFGTELLVSLTQIGPLFDIAYDWVQAKVHANMALE